VASWQVILLAAGVGGVVAAIVNGVFLIVGGKMQANAQTAIVRLNHSHDEKVLELNQAHDIDVKGLEDSWRLRDRKYERLRRHLGVVMRIVIQLADMSEDLSRTPADKVGSFQPTSSVGEVNPDEWEDLTLDTETSGFMQRVATLRRDVDGYYSTLAIHSQTVEANPAHDSLKGIAERANAQLATIRAEIQGIMRDAQTTLRKLEESPQADKRPTASPRPD
jgi:hypothetical protein